VVGVGVRGGKKLINRMKKKKKKKKNKKKMRGIKARLRSA
jgi:hypothetical protein